MNFVFDFKPNTASCMAVLPREKACTESTSAAVAQHACYTHQAESITQGDGTG